jgi:SAM-dependent methyltransferase
VVYFSAEDHLEPINFTAHNIRLENGEYTKPEMGGDVSQYPWFVAARRVLSLVLREDKSRYSLVDLGCLEGGYTVEFARMGFQSLGLEVRESNFAACQYVKERVNLPNLSFVRDDVWNVEKYGSFDATFCCGILYHMDRPRAFLELLSKITKTVIILQTHFARENNNEKFKLSGLTEWEGATGKWYREYASTPNTATREQSKWSSWSNTKSFWLTRPWILQSLQSVGFDLVFEQFDGLPPDIVTSMTTGEYRCEDRSTFVGVRTARL